MYLLWAIAITVLAGGFLITGRSAYMATRPEGHYVWAGFIGVVLGLTLLVISGALIAGLLNL